MLLQFAGEPQTGMTVVAGIHVAEGEKLADSLTKLLPEAAGSDKVEAVTLDAGTARGVKFARIDGRTRAARKSSSTAESRASISESSRTLSGCWLGMPTR